MVDVNLNRITLRRQILAVLLFSKYLQKTEPSLETRIIYKYKGRIELYTNFLHRRKGLNFLCFF